MQGLMDSHEGIPIGRSEEVAELAGFLYPIGQPRLIHAAVISGVPISADPLLLSFRTL